jgi:hypothetical protein
MSALANAAATRAADWYDGTSDTSSEVGERLKN